jgi:ABC-2 type transport system ATP-binding protein
MAAVMSATACDGVSVLLSSHVLAELEQVAGYLVLLSDGRVRLAGEVAGLLASHRLLTGPDEGSGRGPQPDRLVVREAAGDPVPPGWQAYRVSLEELALAYLREPCTASHSQAAASPAVTP